MANNATIKIVGSIVGWSFVPNFATRLLVQALGYFFPRPLSQQQRYQQYRLAYAFVVLSYLLYNFVDAMLSIPPSFYELLGVPPDVDENGLKLAFRAFARRYHPDRVGSAGTTIFVAVRSGYEALMNPTRRWAYNRFGPEILECTSCISEGDFLSRGLLSSLGFHIVSGISLLCFYAFGGHSRTSYWRCIIYLVLAAGEYTFVFSTTPSMRTLYDGPPNLFEYLFPSRVPFQHVKFLHQAFVFLSVALSRVFPVLFPSIPSDPEHGLGWSQVADVFSRIARLDKLAYDVVSTELSSIMHTANGVLTTDDETMALLTTGMERLALEAHLNIRRNRAPGRDHTQPSTSNRQPLSSSTPIIRPVRPRHISGPQDVSFSGGSGTPALFRTKSSLSMRGIPTATDGIPKRSHDWLRLPKATEERLASLELPDEKVPYQRARSQSC